MLLARIRGLHLACSLVHTAQSLYWPSPPTIRNVSENAVFLQRALACFPEQREEVFIDGETLKGSVYDRLIALTKDAPQNIQAKASAWLS